MATQQMDNLGPVDPHLEGSYRRGYHQAVAAIAIAMHHHDVTADTLDAWVQGAGMTWRKDIRLDQQVVAPEITFSDGIRK